MARALEVKTPSVARAGSFEGNGQPAEQRSHVQ
jgi:hypothetical protein